MKALLNLTNFLQANAAVGLTLGAGALRTARVVRTDDGPVLEDCRHVELPSGREATDEEFTAALIEATGELLDDKTRLVVGLGAGRSGMHLFTVPFDRAEKVRRVLKYEAEPLFINDVDDMILDYYPLGGGEDGRKAGLVFGAETDVVAGILDRLAEAGLEANLVMPERLGLVTVGRKLIQTRPDSGVYLFVEIGTTQTGLALFEQDRLIAIRNVFFGSRDVTGHIARTLKLEPAQAENLMKKADVADKEDPRFDTLMEESWRPLFVEMERTLAGSLTGKENHDPLIVLAGEGAGMPGLDSRFARRLELEVTTISDLAGRGSEDQGVDPECVDAYGLALMALSSGHKPNFRQGDLAPSQLWQRYRTHLYLIAAGLAAVLLINLGGLIHSYRIESKRYETVRAEIENVFRETVPGIKKIAAPLAQMRQEIEKAGGTAAGVYGSGRVLDVLLDVSRLAEPHEGLRITSLTLGPESLELQGEGGSFEVIDLFKSELGRLPYFSESTLGGARMDPTTRVLTFRISLKRKTG